MDKHEMFMRKALEEAKLAEEEAPGCIGFPISSRLVAQEEIWKESSNPLFLTISFRINSPIGERHIFPWHMNNTLIITFITSHFLIFSDF